MAVGLQENHLSIQTMIETTWVEIKIMQHFHDLVWSFCSIFFILMTIPPERRGKYSRKKTCIDIHTLIHVDD